MPGHGAVPRPEGAPIGGYPHAWVAALSIEVAEREVRHFQKKPEGPSATRDKPTIGKVVLDRPADVLDVYCDRCGQRPGRREWCDRYPLSGFVEKEPRRTRSDRGVLRS